jgi:hypothetical protein
MVMPEIWLPSIKPADEESIGHYQHPQAMFD